MSTNMKANGDKPYHHGNLVDELVAATIAIIEERGVENISVREAAKRAGVSPGAPFRHFRSKTALMTAVAEQAMSRLTESVEAARRQAGSDDPLVAFEAIGHGYLRWALANPTHFEIISSRTLIDFNSSDILREQNDAIRRLMVNLLAQARENGQLAKGLDLDQLVLSSRALVYGLARMAIDGHFPEWHVAEPPSEAMHKALHLFIGQFPKG
ncbi:MAG: TetR/AcrR family transcriptional regulator [Rhizobiales bacterium]|uniref:TetR/AcrR family transcriptional regulator n=2 Tax=Agrobacterium salinitolerans TaxID=1183413 RepID=A0ABY3BMX2_9HYPH|nr:TetR/AcrR family transcriptional regulator [Hyphomicrobiales bacterium]NTA39513.1 TetR/AcrR family transcriptional regulator [Agrobacterium salinitolerans]TRA88597.1 TetR/AcrR family transcriptional regulator [Agrobacterium salinitolerans]